MPSPELVRIADLLRLDIPSRPNEAMVNTFMRHIEKDTSHLHRIFRISLGKALMERESLDRGHLKIESLYEMLDNCRFQVWLGEIGVSDQAAQNLMKSLQRASTEEWHRYIHNQTYLTEKTQDWSELMLKNAVGVNDAARFSKMSAEMEFGQSDVVRRVFAIRLAAEMMHREESLRGPMGLKELVAFFLYTAMIVELSDYGLEEEILHELYARITLCNNMRRQHLLVHQIERFCFSMPTLEKSQIHSRDFWIHRLNEIELKIALEQYVTREKLHDSDMEMAELYTEAHHLFSDVSELQDETLAVISITYRLDNPEESGHTVEELLSIIDQIKLLTTELTPLNIATRDIFLFFELLGECDLKNRFFHKTILTFQARLRRMTREIEATGDRINLTSLVLTYLYSRLEAFLQDFDFDNETILDGIRGRLAQCHAFIRQFAIVDHIEAYIFENPGLLRITDETHWPELINTVEFNIILDIYFDSGYLTSGSKNKNQMRDELQARINSIRDISVKSLTVVFLTANLSAKVDQLKENKLSLSDVIALVAALEKDAEHAAAQISIQSRVKREMLGMLTSKLYRLEVLQNGFDGRGDHDMLSRLDEVVVGLRTRRDNLIAGKMDPKVLEADIRAYLADPKVLIFIEEVERQYKIRFGVPVNP